jgi:hypothetical protein
LAEKQKGARKGEHGVSCLSVHGVFFGSRKNWPTKQHALEAPYPIKFLLFQMDMVFIILHLFFLYFKLDESDA